VSTLSGCQFFASTSSSFLRLLLMSLVVPLISTLFGLSHAAALASQAMYSVLFLATTPITCMQQLGSLLCGRSLCAQMAINRWGIS
jgi:hypothetical protein